MSQNIVWIIAGALITMAIFKTTGLSDVDQTVTIGMATMAGFVTLLYAFFMFYTKEESKVAKNVSYIGLGMSGAALLYSTQAVLLTVS